MLIGATGGHCDDTTAFRRRYDEKPGACCRQRPEEAREMVRRLHKYGAEVIKICATGGVLLAGDSVGAQQLSLDEMKAIVDEAHMLGLQGRGARPRRRGHQRRDPRRRRHDRARQPRRRRDRSSSPSSTAPGSTWTSTTTITSSPRARRTAPSRRASTRSGRSASSSARPSARASRAGVKMLFGTDAGVYPARRQRHSSSPRWCNGA